jgi:hypothetical protein
VARPRRRLTTGRDLALLVLLVGGGAALRWVHLGTPSLWWDEIMHLAMAQAGGVGDVLRTVRQGIPPASGNAGAAPLDYLLLHAWLAATPSPPAARLEIYYRLPAFVWSVVALAAFAAFSRRHLGRQVAPVATFLLATSIPHVLYAAEVRWYALLVLVTVGHVWAFARLLEAPGSARRWAVWLLAGAVSVSTAVLSIVPLAAEAAVLLVHGRGSRRALVSLGCSGAVIGLLVAWLAAPSLGVNYARPATSRPGLLVTATTVLRFLAWDQPVLLLALAAGPCLAWWQDGPERSRRRPLVAALALAFLAIPLVALLADAKAYYVHPRHVLFLLPGFVILAALGVVGACRMVIGDRWGPAVALALVVAIQAPAVMHFLSRPDDDFARTKTLRDVRGVVAAIATASERMPPGQRWLLLAERQSVPNAVLDRYLHWWGVADRVLFRGTRDVAAALRQLADPSAPLERLAAPPLATIPVGLTEELRAFLHIAADTAPPVAAVGEATVATWDEAVVPPRAGLVERTLYGVRVFARAPAADSAPRR